MKHIRTLSGQAEVPALAQQSALEIKVNALLDFMEVGIGKFLSPNFPRLPDIETGA